MNLVRSSQGVKSTSMASSTVSWKSGGGDVVPDQFPAGLRVLVVDDDPTCLMILEKMLRNCLYEATKCNRAELALTMLRENKNGFDIVISDVHMPDMDGFKLLEHIGLEMDLPVIMMSADDSKSVVMKGVTHGACDYLIKPVRIEALRNIWQHVVRKRKHEWKDFEVSGSVEDADRQQKTTTEEAEYSSSANEGNWKSSSKRRKDDEDEGEERDDSSSLKKPRVVWSVELHQQFVAAVNQLGIDKAVPKKILELMNVPGLTRENVASHLQKYRLYLRRLSGSQHQGGLNSPFIGSPDASFASMNGLDLQALAASGQIQPQSLANFQALRPGSKSHVSIPIDQKNLFSFENPKFRFGEGHPQLSNNSSKHMNLLHGIPTNMEPKQLANLHQSAHSFGALGNLNPHASQNGPLLIPMGQTQSRPSRPQLLNEHSISHMSRQAMLPNGLLARNGLGDNVRETGYNHVSQSSSMVDFSMNQNQELSPNGFPNISSSKGGLDETVNARGKVASGIIPSYDIFNELSQHKSQDWSLQNVGLSFDASQHTNMQGSREVPPSVLLQQSFPGQKVGLNQNSGIGKPMFSAGEDSGLRNGLIGQQSFHGDNALRVKPERLPDVGSQSNTLFAEHFGQEDLMSALLKQQEGIGSSESDFGFDGYNLPV